MKYKNWKDKIKEWQGKYPICPKEYWEQKDFVNPYCFMETLSEYLDKDAIIIPDSGGTLLWCFQGLNLKQNQQITTQFNHSAMGCSIGMAIGAYYANPDKQIISIMGDGAFQMNPQELMTIAFNKLPIKMFVMNNREYGIINQTFNTWLDSTAGSDPTNGLGFPDIKRIAQAYGITSMKINDHEDFPMIEQIIKADGPFLGVVNIKAGQKMIPKLTAGQPLENLWPHLSAEEIKEEMDV